MKLMIASDLHGSDYCTELLCARYAEEAPERLVLLGDLLYHGPRNALPARYDTAACAGRLNALTPPPIAVRGNCDGEVDQLVLSFPMLAETGVLFADGLDNHSVFRGESVFFKKLSDFFKIAH